MFCLLSWSLKGDKLFKSRLHKLEYDSTNLQTYLAFTFADTYIGKHVSVSMLIHFSGFHKFSIDL